MSGQNKPDDTRTRIRRAIIGASHLSVEALDRTTDAVMAEIHDLVATALKLREDRDSQQREAIRAMAESARLREALRLIANFRPTPDECRPPHSQIAVFARQTATEALRHE